MGMCVGYEKGKDSETEWVCVFRLCEKRREKRVGRCVCVGYVNGGER